MSTVAPRSLECKAARNITPTQPCRPASANGQLARVAALLRERRTRGLSSREAIELGILRLPNRVSELRKINFVIEGRAEAGGVMRYWLRSEPENPKPLAASYGERTRQIEAEALPLFAGLQS